MDTLFTQALDLARKLSPAEQRALVAQLEHALNALDAADEWALTGAQLAFMVQHHEMIETAYDQDDVAALDALAESPEYKALFGDMPWDEAYDRYEETWQHDGE